MKVEWALSSMRPCRGEGGVISAAPLYDFFLQLQHQHKHGQHIHAHSLFTVGYSEWSSHPQPPNLKSQLRSIPYCHLSLDLVPDYCALLLLFLTPARAEP